MVRPTSYAEASNQYLVSILRGGDRANLDNARSIWIDTNGRVNAEIRDSAGVVQATMITPALVDMTTETLVRLRWNVAGLPSGNTAELVIDANPPVSGAVAGWVTSPTADTYVFGKSFNSSIESFSGSYNYVKFWAEPQ